MAAPFAAFLDHLFATGEALFTEGFEMRSGRDEALAVLEKAYRIHALSVAGSAIPFDAPSALAAAELVAHACWCSAQRGEPLDEVERCAKALAKTSAPLSVDLTLRFLIQLERRARAVEPGSRLPALLGETLRRYPLTQALMEGVEPGWDPEHPGLLLLYEERLAKEVTT